MRSRMGLTLVRPSRAKAATRPGMSPVLKGAMEKVEAFGHGVRLPEEDLEPLPTSHDLVLVELALGEDQDAM